MAYECLKRLHQEELYSNVAYLGNLLITTMDRRPDAIPPMNRYQACIYYADALSHLGQHRRAESIYMKALLIRKSIAPSSKANSKSPASETRRSVNEFTSETEVKYRLYVCLLKQRKYNESVGLLESIPTKQRNAKINCALAELYKHLNQNQAAAQQYKDLLTNCPYAIEAIVELMNFGVGLEEIQSLCSSSNVDLGATLGVDWLPTWFSGQASIARRDYATAVSNFRDLDTKTVLANNPNILCSWAMAFYYAGEHSKACTTLQRVHTLDPLYVECMDVLGALLSEEKRTKELESLATHLMQTAPDAKQSWVTMGYLCRALKKLPKAMYFAHKACGDGRHQAYVEAMLLKGLLLMDLKKYNEASLHFHEAVDYNPHRYELYEGLVNCELERNKMVEARVAAKLCLKKMGQTARSITLYATVLSKDASTLSEAQSLLERAVSSAPYLLNAVYLLVSIYDRQKQYDKAVELLKRQTSLCVNSKLHGLLGDLLSKSTHYEKALDSYRFALSLDPADEASITGMNELSSNSTQTTRVWETVNRGLTSNSANATNTASTTTSTLNAHANGGSAAQAAVGTMTTPEVVITSFSIQSMPPNAPARLVRPNFSDRSANSSTTASAPTISVTTPDVVANLMDSDLVHADISME